MTKTSRPSKIRIFYTQGIEAWIKENNAYTIPNLISYCQHYFMCEDSLEGFSWMKKNQNIRDLDDKLEKNWDFSRELQFWEINDHKLTMNGTEVETGESFPAFYFPITRDLEFKRIWVGISPIENAATLYLPEEH